jgi:hypothetical protein
MANGTKRTKQSSLKLVSEEQPEQPELSHVPEDAIDIASLLEPELGDAITEATMLTIPIGKPKDFFRTHPDKSYRPQAMICTHKAKASSRRNTTLWGRKCAVT